MINKSQVIVFVASFFIGGLFLLSLLRLSIPAYAGSCPPQGCVCCDENDFAQTPVCADSLGDCNTLLMGTVCESDDAVQCVDALSPCTCISPPQIPTLNEWGTIIIAGMLGLFAVIGLIAMRRGSVVKAGS